MAGWLLKRLGYGSFEVVDKDNPTNPPSVNSSGVADTFTRILQNQVYETEEIRRAAPSSFVGSYEFIAFGPKGASTGASVWDCVRCTWSMGKKVRFQYLENISWDDREVQAW